MLVLSRKKMERILIGRDVYITIVSIGADKVRLGIQAPEHVSIDREEVFLAKLAESEKD
jgi:carbon storage regulator